MILILAMAAVLTISAIAGLLVLVIGMRTEGNRMSPDSAPRDRVSTAARRILGVYVRRPEEPKFHDARR
jgi:hypothetical protein